MQAPPEFTRLVGNALAHLYDPDVLRKHPLLNLLGINIQLNAQSVLREKLIQAIEELKPAPDVPIDSRAWRIYKVLHIRYVQQMDQEQTAYQIGVGVRHLRREQSAAVTALADVLYQKVDRASSEPNPVAADRPGPLEEEFAWLQKNADDQASSVNEILLDAVRLVSPLANSRSFPLETDLAEDLPPAVILPAALRQALISLTSLAINRLIAGEITVTTRLNHQEVEVSVTAASQQRLLPETPATHESLRAVRLILGNLSPGLITLDENSPSGSSCTYRLALPALGMISVLMIDDNKDVADLFKRYTYGTQFSIEYQPDPQQVFEVVKRLQPRIILLDIMIPQIDGWELLGRLRQHPLTHTRPIIVCSVLPERELALALGATAYLSKPAARSTLLETLNQTLAQDAAHSG